MNNIIYVLSSNNTPALRKSEIEYYAMLAKVRVSMWCWVCVCVWLGKPTTTQPTCGGGKILFLKHDVWVVCFNTAFIILLEILTTP